MGYSYPEQMRDVLPAFVLAGAAFAAGYPIGLLATPALLTVVLQLAVFSAAYLVLAWLFHVEEFSYLCKNLRSILVGRHNAA